MRGKWGRVIMGGVITLAFVALAWRVPQLKRIVFGE